jgi:phage/conjugal plasmid C-4 type zinc finger TraR family protein
MSDEIDDAQQLQIYHTETAIAGVVSHVKEPGCTDCQDCGEPIDQQRRTAYPAARRCIDCQRRREKKVP